MSIDATNWAWSQRDVTPTEKLILLSYADRAGETHEAWPSWSRLILDTGLDRKTIYYGLGSLQKKGKMIKTGEKKGQVYVYRLIGVTSRESNELPSSNKKLSTTRSKNGTGSSSENGTTTSSENGTKNHQLNHQRNPNAKPPFFSDFKTFVTDLVIASGKKPVDVLVEEVLFYADEFKDKRDPLESVNMAIPLIKKGLWKTPHKFKDITSQSIREKDEQHERKKQEQHQKDAEIVRAIKTAVIRGQKFSPKELIYGKIKDNHANQGAMPEKTVSSGN